MKYILIALLSLAILVTAVVADESRDSILQLQADVQQLQTDFDRTRKGGTRMVFLDYDIETALAYINSKDTEGFMRYCQNNDLDYNALIDLLISKGFIKP